MWRYWEISSAEVIWQVGEDESKYLDILEKGYFIKENKEEIYQEVEVSLKAKFNAKNVFSAINIGAVQTASYATGIIE